MATPSGEIYLLRNVPLTPAYEHTIDFTDKDEQFSYFSSFIKNLIPNEAYSYIRRDREYIAVELSLKDLDDVNYMLFRSADSERLYYAFITEKRYVNDVSSYIFFEIDVLQTFAFDYKWQASYIKQAHVDRWTAELKPKYSLTDEGLDYGQEYAVESAFKITSGNDIKWLLVSLKDYSTLAADGSDIVDIGDFLPMPSPFACLMLPITPEDQLIKYRANGLELPILASGNYHSFLKLMLSGKLGEYVQNIALLPYNPFIRSISGPGVTGYEIELEGEASYYGSVSFTDGTEAKNFLLVKKLPNEELFKDLTLAKDSWNLGIENSLPTAEQWAEAKKKPYTTPRDKRYESKLLCAPYRYNLLTDWRNNPVVFKNEYLPTTELEIKFRYAFSYNAPFRYWLKDYKRDTLGRITCLSQPLALEMPIISDAYYTYMLQNKNTIQANLTNTIINAGTGVISGAIAGAGVGGIGGAAYGAITGAVSGGLNVQAHIRSENAKQQDLKAKPDTVINSTDSAFSVIDGTDEINFYRMKICCENEEIIADIFNMTGYKVNRVELPNTRSRTRFNYIQTMGANLIGSFSQDDLLKIKAIYDKGVTIWHYNKEAFNMLDYSYENLERNLL